MIELLWALVGLVVVVLALYSYKWSDAPPLHTEPAPEIPPTDPMVLCPVCGFLGYHSLDEVPAKRNPIRTFETPDGETVEINVLQGGLPGYWRRQCCFCEHVWSVPLAKEEAG